MKNKEKVRARSSSIAKARRILRAQPDHAESLKIVRKHEEMVEAKRERERRRKTMHQHEATYITENGLCSRSANSSAQAQRANDSRHNAPSFRDSDRGRA
jgi:hypothetical protein